MSELIKFEVAVPTPMPQTFTYLGPPVLQPGARVLVPFGSRRVIGVVVRKSQTEASSNFELKEVVDIVDEEPSYSSVLMELASWLSRYYMHPIGDVLRTMLPASTVKLSSEKLALSEKGMRAWQTESHAHHAVLQALYADTAKSYAKSTLAARWRALRQQSSGSDQFRSVAELKRLGYLVGRELSAKATNRRGQKNDLDRAIPNSETKPAPTLTTAQQSVLKSIVENGLATEHQGQPFLLLGVTGSGKTEVYLAVIEELLKRDHGSQVLVMVPEIALTPQMTRVFTQRFSEVAVVHSAMSDRERSEQLQRIRSGKAKVLIGPRSAVFAPFCKLRLVIVDEEHDASYKQSTGLMYHGRDVAVLRAKLEGATIVLGSATPSMESYQNAKSGKYRLLELPQRVTGRELPQIQIIQTEVKPGSTAELFLGSRQQGEAVKEQNLLAPEVIDALVKNHEVGKQAIVLVNRRGYAFYLFDPVTRETLDCPHCSISLTLHRKNQQLRCHYCDYHTSLAEVKESHPDKMFLAVGYGSQKVEDLLAQLLPQLRVLRIDSDTMQSGQMAEALESFRAGKVDVLVGTQMLAKGHDFPNVTLIALVEIDQQLSMPDFRAGERTYQLIVQAAGRAGRAQDPGQVLLQSSRATHPIVRLGLNQDFKKFAENELAFRSVNGYPPFSRMVSIEFSSEDLRELSKFCDGVAQWFEVIVAKNSQMLSQVKILGPAVPGIEKIRMRHRRQLLLIAKDPSILWRLTNSFQQKFARLPTKLRVRVDVDPQSLL